jgi:hypothetical protein
MMFPTVIMGMTGVFSIIQVTWHAGLGHRMDQVILWDVESIMVRAAFSLRSMASF